MRRLAFATIFYASYMQEHMGKQYGKETLQARGS
jgi:hypothetical protein